MIYNMRGTLRMGILGGAKDVLSGAVKQYREYWIRFQV